MIWTKLQASDLRHWGGLAVKLTDAGLKATPGALLDFSAVLTTKDRDRDGDTLDPRGGDLDPAMPLLWSHAPDKPIGKMVRVLHRDADSIQAQYCIADTPLGRDAAALLKLGCLRMSHGFKPTKAMPQTDGHGWCISKWQCVESSLVAIPANPGAGVLSVVEAVKSFGGSTIEARRLVDDLRANSGFDQAWAEHCMSPADHWDRKMARIAADREAAQRAADAPARLDVDVQPHWQKARDDIERGLRAADAAELARRKEFADGLREISANLRIALLNIQG